jgi:hypothetical protein
VLKNIDDGAFAEGLNEAIEAVFRNAPRTKLFITGYPRFWNEKTDACDKVSFKFGCINNSILPLIKARRSGMNALTDRLNDKIKSKCTWTKCRHVRHTLNSYLQLSSTTIRPVHRSRLSTQIPTLRVTDSARRVYPSHHIATTRSISTHSSTGLAAL